MQQPGSLTRTLGLTTLAMCAFAANSIFCRLALAHTTIDPATFTVIRIGAGALVLTLLVAATAPAVERSTIAGSWPGALALLAYAACFSYAYMTLTASTGALILFGAVQATMIASGLIAGERMSALQWIGLALALAGLAALLAPGITAPDPRGAVLMAVAGIAWGFYSLRGRGGQSPLATTAGNFLRAAPLALPLLALSARSWDAYGVLWAILSGAVASGLGYAVWYAALPRLSAAQAASIQLSVPIITTIGGAVLLSETISGRLIIASATVLGGIALVVLKKSRAANAAVRT